MEMNFKFLSRSLLLFARWLTGIDIHPQAKIGEAHRSWYGAVIGQTSTIGENVTLYHGVTLGGVNPAENLVSKETKNVTQITRRYRRRGKYWDQ